jgi:hypothetical protein
VAGEEGCCGGGLLCFFFLFFLTSAVAMAGPLAMALRMVVEDFSFMDGAEDIRSDEWVEAVICKCSVVGYLYQWLSGRLEGG